MRVVEIQLKKSGFYEAVLEEEVSEHGSSQDSAAAESRLRSLEAIRYLEDHLQKLGHGAPLYGDVDFCYGGVTDQGLPCLRRKISFRF